MIAGSLSGLSAGASKPNAEVQGTFLALNALGSWCSELLRTRGGRILLEFGMASIALVWIIHPSDQT